MGKKGGWFSSVRKAFYPGNDPKDNKEKKPQKTTSGKSWFGTQTNESESSQPESAPEDDPKVAEQQAETSEPTEPDDEPSNERIPENEANEPAKVEDDAIKLAKTEIEYKKPTKPDNEPSKPAYTSRVAVAAAAFRRFLGKSKEDVAAIKVQTAFRRFLARKRLKALKGLVRLKVLVQSQSVKRQAVATLKCMQTLARVQSQVRARRIRMSEENLALQRQLMQKRDREIDNVKSYLGNDWDNTRRSKEQVIARMQHKETAAARRERALAYAQTQQKMWKNPSKAANPTFMDPNNPQWGWSWLDRWMASRPWESQSQTEGSVENEQPHVKLLRSSSVGDVSIQLEQSPSMSSPRSPSRSNRRLTLSSPKGINSHAPSPLNRRHSIANSSFREGATARVSSTRSTKTKSVIPTLSQGKSTSRSPSPSPLGGKKVTVEKKTSMGPATRRMSLSNTPSTRRMSLSSTPSTSTGGGRGGGGSGGGGGGGGGGNRRLSMSSRVGSSTR